MLTFGANLNSMCTWPAISYVALLKLFRLFLISHGGKQARYPGPDVPEEIWCRIHFLLPIQDAARAACVSRSFLHSWRCHPNLTFTNETMCPKEDLKAAGSNAIIRDYNKIDRVLRNRSCADGRDETQA